MGKFSVPVSASVAAKRSRQSYSDELIVRAVLLARHHGAAAATAQINTPLPSSEHAPWQLLEDGWIDGERRDRFGSHAKSVADRILLQLLVVRKMSGSGKSDPFAPRVRQLLVGFLQQFSELFGESTFFTRATRWCETN